MTKLSQMVAVEAGVKTDAAQAVAQAEAMLRADKAAFAGLIRTFAPVNEDMPEAEWPPDQGVNVQVSVEQVLSDLQPQLARLFDVTLTKEDADTQARADVVVTRGGKPFTLVADAPVSYLLFLEKQAARLEERVIAHLPVLSAAEDWVPATGRAGLFQTGHRKTQATDKVRRNHVKFGGDAHHPPQVEVFTDDVVVGTWSTVKFSGAVFPDRVRELLERVREFRRAVIAARTEANSIAVTDRKAGNDVLGWLFSG